MTLLRRTHNVAAIGVIAALALLILFGLVRYDHFLSLYKIGRAHV